MMRSLLVTVITTLVLSVSASAQPIREDNALEKEIKKLEQAQVDLLLRGDIKAMRSNWAKDYVVNNPFNEAVDASKGPIASGSLTYSSFTRIVERVLDHGTTVIVMGRETVVPKGTSPDAGKTIERRFTNIWMKREGNWLLTARHASVICPAK